MKRFALLAFLALGCSVQLVEPKREALGCVEAGAHLRRLSCPEAYTPGGMPFAEACEIASKDGRDWRPDCIALVSSCSEVEDAYRTPRGVACSR